MDLVISPDALGKAPSSNPSRSAVKTIKRAACFFVRHELCSAVAEGMASQLNGLNLKVQVRPQPLRRDVPDQDPMAIYINYPVLFKGDHSDYGVLKVNCSVLSAALDNVWKTQHDLLTIHGDDYPDGACQKGFAVRSVSDMHALTEKMLMLHEMYHYEGLSERYLEGNSRQLYEIVLLHEQLCQKGVSIDKKLYDALRAYRHT